MDLVSKELEPTQDWMLLEPVLCKSDLALPDGYDQMAIENRKDIQMFKVISIGPWKEYPVEGSDNWVAVDVKPGDLVMVEGINFAAVEHKGEKFAVSRARNVIYFVREE